MYWSWWSFVECILCARDPCQAIICEFPAELPNKPRRCRYYDDYYFPSQIRKSRLTEVRLTGPKSPTYLIEEQGFKARAVWLQKRMLFTSQLNLQSFPCIFHAAESFGLLVFWVISVNGARPDISSALGLVSSLFRPFSPALSSCTPEECSPPALASFFLLPLKE